MTALFRLYAATALFTLAMGVAMPIVPQALTERFGASVTFVGIAGALYGVTQIVLRLPMGDLADRRGRRASLLGSFALVAVSGVIYAVAASAWWILPAQALFGFAAGIFWVAANATLFDSVPPEDVPKATANYAFAIGLAQLVAPPLGGLLADELGYAASLASVAVFGFLGLVLVATIAETAPLATRPAGGVYARAWRIFQNPDIRVSAWGTFFFSVLFAGLTTFLPLYLRIVGFSAFGVGILFSIRQGAGTAVRFGAARLIERFGARAVVIVGLAVAAVTSILVPFFESPWTLTPLLVVAGLGTGVMIPANLTLVARGAPAAEKGLANGIYGTALGVGHTVGPFALGFVAAHAGLAWTFWGMGGFALVGALWLTASKRRGVHGESRGPRGTARGE